MPHLKRYQALKLSRAAVSVVVTALLSLIWVEFGDMVLCAFGWLERWLIIPVGIGVSFITVAFWLAFTSLFGRNYCSGICPLGTLQDAVAHIGRATRKGISKDYRYSPPRNRLRYAVLSIVVVCWFISLSLIPAIVEPDSMYSSFIRDIMKPLWGHANNVIARIGVATGWWSVTYVAGITVSAFAAGLSLISILTVSTMAWFFGRTYCNTICPVGTLLGVVSRQSLWHIDIDTDLCINCGKCEQVCKASCLDLQSHVVDGSRCINCFNCLTVCPNDAIFYRPTKKQLSIPMMQRMNAPKVGATTASMAGDNIDTINTDKSVINPNETISRTDQ